VILASYGAELAEHWGREVRNEFEQNPRLFTRLREDSTAANRWNTPKGGGMVAVGVGGPVVGFGGNLIVVDDPHKNEEEAGTARFTAIRSSTGSAARSIAESSRTAPSWC
jgi:hypothetical protein